MKQKTVLITGASRGIGKEIAIVLAKSNFNVVINYCKHKKEAEIVASEINRYYTKAVALQADVSDKTQVFNMIDRAKEIFGSIDILINNAGVAQQKLFTDISESDWDHMFNVNVKGVFNCTQAILKDMINAKEGKIVNIASIWGMVGASCEAHYSASKAAVIGLTKALAKEVGPSGIQVNCVAPGVIATDMISEFTDQDLDGLKDQTPLGVIGKPVDVANVVKFLISPQANFITGQIISPNGGFII